MSTAERVEVAGLQVGRPLYDFLVDEAIPGSPIDADAFWEGFASLVADLTPRNRELLEIRERMQSALDEWYRGHRDGWGQDEYQAFLRELGYLVDEGDDFSIDTSGVDPEIASIAGPQLVVPVTNARYALNAVNARWGSLYDALYGTDAMGDAPPPGGFDTDRGERVIAWVRDFLDEVVPLDGASHADVTRYRVADGAMVAEVEGKDPALVEPEQFAAHGGDADAPTAILLRSHGLGIELRVDADDRIGRMDRAGVADVVIESAVTTIVDCEDSIAAVDAYDKATAYRHWLGLVTGRLEARVTKGGDSFIRRLHDNRTLTRPDGEDVVVRARSLMLIRNVGHLMDTPAVLDADGNPVPEGLLDAMVTVLCATRDADRPEADRNSPAGSVYVVKPKMHGPDEVAFTDEVFTRVEQVLGLEANTVKIGIMDEERRTSANLKECIRAARSRVAFINTGFLDRTGDEIHTSMEAGPMVRKAEMKSQPWMSAYEDRNVDIGLACGLQGRAQIGKGMWAEPANMAAMLEQKIGHPRAGANTAWVPSPTAATLHATHYHHVDVFARQDELAGREPARLSDLLTVPVTEPSWSDDEITDELENNCQGILGYVVRWVQQGVGCSTVPDINDVGKMEDRATCRISSQHIANWLRHGVVTTEQVDAALRRMAEKVDVQNEGDPLYTPMAPSFDSPAFLAARDLIMKGTRTPSGYTEPVLHDRRAQAKEQGFPAEPDAPAPDPEGSVT
jgi:malate synthase